MSTDTVSSKVRKRASGSETSALLAEFDSSGKSASAFARSKGIPAWRMYGALRRRAGKTRSRRVPANADRTELVPVRVVDARPAPAIELVLNGGHRVLIGADFDPAVLRRLLGALSAC
jgi:hypothetical protein